MTPEERATLTSYRLDQAAHTLRQADTLASIDEWPGVVNRAYYSMLYAASALLLTRELRARKHTGVLALIDREFVHEGLFPKELSSAFRMAFSLRERSDYAEVRPVSEEQARQVLEDARMFLATVHRVLSGSTDSSGSGR